MLKQLSILSVFILGTTLYCVAQDETDFNYTIPKPTITLPKKSNARIEIDGKRSLEDLFGKDALYRGREFQRIDSTYYVGYLFEGIARYENAADILGYKLATEPLEKAMMLIEKDYDHVLKTRPKNVYDYLAIHQYQIDYDLISERLQQCYQNTEQTSKAIETIRRFQKRKIIAPRYNDAYINLAWIYHRNRFCTSKDAPQLCNSIDSNEAYAHRMLDSFLINSFADSKAADYLYTNSAEIAIPQAAHYRAILYTYSNNIDSGKKYYDILNKTNPSYNNYATFLSIQGKFADAVKAYEAAEESYSDEKSLQEHVYYRALLFNYDAKPYKGISLCKQKIAENGSTPGFGWYNLALARNYLYDGQLEKANFHLSKAERFQEVHIGTTLGKSHYNFTLGLLKLVSKEKQIAWLKFKNKLWWLSASEIAKVIALTIEKFTTQYFLINSFANNPERDLVIYKLFSTESTISFDEVWYLIKDFSTDFFVKKYTESLSDTNRPLLRKYFALYLAKLQQLKGNVKEAQAAAPLPQDTTTSYNALHQARLYELMALLNVGDTKSAFLDKMTSTYPQLVPFTNFKPRVSLHYSGPLGPVENEILSKLKKSRINFVAPSDDAGELFLSFENTKGKSTCTVHYTLANNQSVGGYNTVEYENAQQGSELIMQTMFNIGVGEMKDSLAER